MFLGLGLGLNNKSGEASPNYAVSLNGTSQYIDLSTHIANLDFDAPFSLFFRAKLNGSHLTVGGAVFTIQNAAFTSFLTVGFGVFSGAFTNELVTVRYINTAATVNSGVAYTTASDIFSGIWVDVCLTGNGTAWTLYINGVSVSLTTFSANSGKYGDSMIGTNCYIGARSAVGVFSQYFPGELKDVCLWNTQLTAAQVLSAHLSATPYLIGSGIKGAWLTSNDYNDVSGNGYNGTAVGTPSFVANSFIDDAAKYFQQVSYSNFYNNYTRRNPHSQINITTSSRYILVQTFLSGYSATVTYSFTVYKNGSYLNYYSKTTNGIEFTLVDLGDTNSKTVKIITGEANAPFATTDGLFIQSVIPKDLYTNNTESNSGKYIFITDSIGVGRVATNGYENDGFVGQLRDYVKSSLNFDIAMFGYSGLSTDDIAATSPLLDTISTAVNSVLVSNSTIIVTLGANDFGQDLYSAATYQTYYTSLLNRLHTDFPTTPIIVISPIVRTIPAGANSFGSTIQDYRDAAEAVTVGRESYCTYIDGLDILSDAAKLAADGTHPIQTGHNTMYTNLLTELGI